jgi:hypothetical protein
MNATSYYKVLYHVYVPSRLDLDQFVDDYNVAEDFYRQFADEYGEAHLHEECYRTEEEYEDAAPSEEDCLLNTEREEAAV